MCKLVFRAENDSNQIHYSQNANVQSSAVKMVMILNYLLAC